MDHSTHSVSVMNSPSDIEKKGDQGVETDVVSVVERRAHDEGVDSIYDMKSELSACLLNYP